MTGLIGYVFSFTLIFIFVRRVLLQACDGQITTQKNGKMLENYVLDKLTVTGYKQCARECFVRTDCASINYNVVDKTCELNTANETDVPLSINDKYIYIDKSNIPSDFSGSYSEVTCPSGYKSIPLKNGQTRCHPFLLDKPENCRNTLVGKEYHGTINVTAMGITCQQWSSDAPHAHTWNSLPSNYCRNPGGSRYGPWCYTTDPAARWQYCDIPFCIHKKQKECKTTTRGYEYFGLVNTTITGKECQAWALDTPHGHANHELPGNECRNPDGSTEGPWCYTTDISSRWEYCNVPFC